MKRRHWVVAAAGIGAATAGAGWKWWAERRIDAESGGLWSMRFDRPGGGDLSMAEFRGRPLLLNFWATWCAPCVQEMPLLDRFAGDFKARRGQVVGLAIDRDRAVRDFLQRSPVGYAIGVAGFEGVELTQRLGNPHGALPFTVVFDDDGGIVKRKLGESTSAELTEWLKLL